MSALYPGFFGVLHLRKRCDNGSGRGLADNAAMESFFAALQKNVLNRQRWQTRKELRLAIVN
jgi:hypothetical protein